jgi:signal transduction histidine kinase
MEDGSGMADEVLGQAFDSDFMTQPAGKGSGLRPGQIQRFVRESGSAVEIKSEVGIGTAVRMLLPVSRQVDIVDLSPIRLQHSRSWGRRK